MASHLPQVHPWFELCQNRPQSKYQLFIFPSAGAPGQYYRKWGEELIDCELSIVIYPGRGSRFADPFIKTMKHFISQLDQGLLPFINRKCIFIGHSLGSAISYELAKHMIDKKKKDTNLELLVEMGRGPPHLTDPDRPYSQMTDKEIIAELKSMADPTTKEIFEYPEYIQMVLPMLKADSKVGEELSEAKQLDIPIIVYGGNKERNVDEPFLNRWKELTTKEDLFLVRMFNGGHHFQSECEKEVLQSLKQDLNKYLS